MEDFFNSSVLSNLYENKREEFEKRLAKISTNKEDKSFILTQNKIKEYLKKNMKKEENIKEMEQLLNELELNWGIELLYLEESYYKLGVVDGFKLKDELKENKENEK